MNKDGTSSSNTTPRLRFPEFAGESLRHISLGDVTAECTARHGKDEAHAAIMGVSKIDGIVPMEERLIGKDIARYKVLKTDWFAYNPMRINIGSIARWSDRDDVLVSPDYVVFRCLDEGGSTLNASYLDHCRTAKQWEDFVGGSGDGGVRIRIYYKDLARLPISVGGAAEQQKIAGCLTSLDEVIAAQGRKVAALADHKRALMQQLFPREGQSLPRLRFPEFRDSGEWKVDRFERLYTFERNNAHSRDKLNYVAGKVKNIHYGDIHTKFQTHFHMTRETVPYINETESVPPFDSEDYCVEGDLIFADASEDTNDVGKCIELVDLNGERLLSGQHTILARRTDDRLAVGFGGYLFRSKRIRRQIEKEAQGTKVYAISAKRLSDVEVAFPNEPAEQQRIAACLSALDAQIAAESAKRDALKTHKKALMQQLFPPAAIDGSGD